MNIQPLTQRNYTPQARSANTPPAPDGPSESFTYQGLKEDGRYDEVTGSFQGQPVDLKMERQPHYNKIGGIMIEGDPTYAISGSFGASPVQLSVNPESQISDVGGIHVETGVVYHVAGQIAGAPYQEDISSQNQISDVGGIHVETDRWTNLHGNAELTVRTIHQTAQSGGIQWETDRYNTVSGKDGTGPVELQLRGLEGSEEVQLSGQASPSTLAALVALRPFLT